MASRAPGWIHIKFNNFSITNQLKTGLESARLDSYEIWRFFNWESIKEWPQEFQDGLLWNVIGFNQDSSKEWPQELQARFIWNLIIFQLRSNWWMASRAPVWIHMKFDHFPIEDQLKNGLKSSRLDSDEIWSFFNSETIKEWPQERQAGFIGNLIIVQLRMN